MTVPGRVLIIGTGLIGTSIALALRSKGADVFLSDFDPAVARLAADLGAGVVVPDLRDAKGIADVAVLAMPPAYVGPELLSAQECAVADVYTDVASVKVLPVAQARALGCDTGSYVPSHPLAGRERQGPAAAQADLFLGRTWALCPLPETSPDAVAAVTALAVACGAVPVSTDPETHDRWVALVSHAPHLVAVAMAARLAPSAVPGDALKLAGQGIRDVTRIAAGDTALWTQILAANAGPVAEVVAAVAEDLAAAARALAAASAVTPAPAAAPTSADTPVPADAAKSAGTPSSAGSPCSAGSPVSAGTAISAGTSEESSGGPEPADLSGAVAVIGLLDRGLAGVARIPGKHGGQPRNFTVVQVVLADRPGELARLFNAAGEAGVNIEDIRLEHSPGLPVGVAELSIRPDQAVPLLDAMEAGGWPVRRLRHARLPPTPAHPPPRPSHPPPTPARQCGSLIRVRAKVVRAFATYRARIGRSAYNFGPNLDHRPGPEARNARLSRSHPDNSKKRRVRVQRREGAAPPAPHARCCASVLAGVNGWRAPGWSVRSLTS